MKKKLLKYISLLVVVLISVIVVGSVGFTKQQEGYRKEGIRIGNIPPAFSVKDIDKNKHTLEQYKGKIVILHFWATWCPFCRREIPKLTNIHENLSSKNVVVLTVSVDEDKNKLKQFVKDSDIAYPVILDDSNLSLAQKYGVMGVPVTYIIDKDGIIVSRMEGSSDILKEVGKLIDS